MLHKQDADHWLVAPARRLVLRQGGHGQGVGQRPRTESGKRRISANTDAYLSKCMYVSQDEKNHANWSGRHYLERFDQPLNCKLNLAVRPNRAKGASSRFRFKYLAGKEEDK